MAFRVPTPTVSVVDLTVKTEKPTSYEEICQKMKEAASGSLRWYFRIHRRRSRVRRFHSLPRIFYFRCRFRYRTKRHFLKLVSWYDNEWGYSNRCIDLLKKLRYTFNILPKTSLYFTPIVRWLRSRLLMT